MIYAVPLYAKEIELVVGEDVPEDTGNAVTRISEPTRNELEVEWGNEIEIIGPRVVKAKIGKLENFSKDINLITVDRSIREKIPIAIGIKVAVRKPMDNK